MSCYGIEYIDDFLEDYVNEELEDLKLNARDYLIGVLDNLYGKKFDASNLEHCLEELCNVLGYPFKFNEHLKVCALDNNYLKAIA